MVLAPQLFLQEEGADITGVEEGMYCMVLTYRHSIMCIFYNSLELNMTFVI